LLTGAKVDEDDDDDDNNNNNLHYILYALSVPTFM
jgi:hypothetical protein